MKKAFATFFILAGLVVIVHSTDIEITVGSDNDDFVFTPQIANAQVGDNVCISILFVSCNNIVPY